MASMVWGAQTAAVWEAGYRFMAFCWFKVHDLGCRVQCCTKGLWQQQGNHGNRGPAAEQAGGQLLATHIALLLLGVLSADLYGSCRVPLQGE